ncbi:MAG: GAF domain-containing sensor histidine kinase [Polyangiales bacterium]
MPLILDVICRATGMRFAAVARVTEDRWVCLASKDQIQFGLQPGGELQIKTTICDEIRRSRRPVVIDHVAADAEYCTHHTPAQYGFQSYISVPIFLSDGTFYGTLCAIDPEPAELKAAGAVDMLRLYAELIAAHLDTAQRAVRAEASLLDARAAAELREQFIAVLGHDLRNPLSAFSVGLAFLREVVAHPKGEATLDRMQRSVQRMSALIDNVLDFARGRLGGGITLQRTSESLEPTLRHVVDELSAAHTHATVELTFDLSRPVSTDRDRIAQLLSNLLSNALVHGAPGTVVRVSAAADRELVLSVSNQGAAIPAEDLPRLFAPFSRGVGRTDRRGLGLGLFIAAEIARAHGGLLEAESSEGLTRFTFRMPL